MRKSIQLLFFVMLAVFLASCATIGMQQAATNTEKASTTASATNSNAAGYTFRYVDSNASSVNLVGDFNSWNTSATAMTKNGSTWESTLPLKPGKYQYKFYVNGTDWKTDPTNTNSADDGYGGKNSVIEVTGSIVKQTTTKQKSSGNAVFQYKDANAISVSVAGDFNDWNMNANPMDKKDGVWTLSLPLTPGKHLYKFVVNGSDWKIDPSNSVTEDDGYGGKNSVIEAGAATTPSSQVESPQSSSATETSGTVGTFPVTFRYQPLTGGKKSVFLAGDFNSWSTSATTMPEKNGIYEITLSLRPGKYAYKFYVDNTWVTDENAKELVSDGYGGQNSVVYAGDQDEINALRQVTFAYKPTMPATDVYLAGSMNDWNQKATEMQKQADGNYAVTLLLKPGEYTYKFVVNGSNWTTDPKAKSTVDDGFGGKNSQLTVDASFPKITIKVGDGQILTYGLPTVQSLETINPLAANKIEFKAKAHVNDISALKLDLNGKMVVMDKIASDGSFDYYQYLYTWDGKPFQYQYVYTDGDIQQYLGLKGFAATKGESYTYPTASVKPFYTPDWAKNGIIYQIFPDRFYNGDKSNDPKFTEWYYQGVNVGPAPNQKLPKNKPYYHFVSDWYDISGLTKSQYHQGDQPEYNTFYGGDAKGVIDKLDYLSDLGVTIIYLNPVFKAKSNHRYDAADYMLVDPAFGTNAEFKEMVAKAHAKGIKVILDVAFNHTGETFWAFQDGMKKGQASPYYNWYEWKKWPLPDTNSSNFKPSDYYDCWWGFGEMPNLNYDLKRPNSEENGVKAIADAQPNQAVVDHILSVAQYWVGDLDIDGFRLDVPNEVPFWFWELFRNKVKSIKPDAWLVGEIWTNAVDWVNDKYFDSVMNYAYFKDPVYRYIVERRGSAKSFDRDLKPGVMNYPVQASQTMMNLVDSHDTVRFLEAANGDLNKLKLAAFFGMTYVGVPHIWYGDENGMRGGKDPDCRRPMNWKYTETPDLMNVHNWYKKLISVRKAHSALRTGSISTVYAEGWLYGFKRQDNSETAMVFMNNDNTAHNADLDGVLTSGTWVDALTNKEISVTNNKISLTIPPMSGYILFKR